MAKPNKLALAKNRVKKALAENETLKKAGAAIRRANTEQNRQLVMIGGVSAGAGGVAGYLGQEKINAMDLPDIAKNVGPIPSLTIVGAAIAAVSIMKLKGKAQAAGAGLGGGMAGGAYVYKLANE
jgi:hypothetical protein